MKKVKWWRKNEIRENKVREIKVNENKCIYLIRRHFDLSIYESFSQLNHSILGGSNWITWNIRIIS